MGTQHWRRVGAGVALGLLLLAVSLPAARAAGPGGDPRAKFIGGNSVTIPADVTISHDLYVFGGTIRIAGRIDGDLIVTGGTIEVTGPVSGDLFAAGGTVNVSSEVGRHVRATGGTVTVNGAVGSDLMVAAGTLDIGPAARVGGDLIFAAQQATSNGAVSGSVLGTARSYTNNGTVGGSEQVNLRQQQQEERAPTVAEQLLEVVRHFISVIAAGALFLWLAPRLMHACVERERSRTLVTFGIGVLAFAGFFVLILALLFAMALAVIPLGLLGFGQLAVMIALGIALGIGLLGYVFALVLLFLAAAIAGLTLGRLILVQLGEQWARGPFPALIFGVLIIVVLTALPYLGILFNILVVLLGLGAVVAAIVQQQDARVAGSGL
jgi:cytoskeletal protein CcmA (bactofilin family)